jgi:hypothetical protein
MPIKINGYWSIKATQSKWFEFESDNKTAELEIRFTAVHAREARQSHRQGNEFQNKFLITNNYSSLSEICKIRNVWKLPSPISRNTLIPCSEKFSWS